MANTSEHMTIRLPKHLSERVRARAEAEGRSVSGMMTRLVQHAMEGRADTGEMANGSSITFRGGSGEKLQSAAVPEGYKDLLEYLVGKNAPATSEEIAEFHAKEKERASRPRHAKTCKCLMCKPPQLNHLDRNRKLPR